ncbi:MAG: hypothetical protein ACI3ZM_02880 [Candidatus Cryptobacteroides sp.]
MPLLAGALFDLGGKQSAEGALVNARKPAICFFIAFENSSGLFSSRFMSLSFASEPIIPSSLPHTLLRPRIRMS